MSFPLLSLVSYDRHSPTFKVDTWSFCATFFCHETVSLSSFFCEMWLAMFWINCGQASWLDTNSFRLPIVDTYADPNGYLPGSVHNDWLSSFEWKLSCLIFTQSLDGSHLIQSSGRPDSPRFRTVFRVEVWLLLEKLFLLSRGSICACRALLDLWTFQTTAEAAVENCLCWLSSRMEARLGVVDVHQDVLIWGSTSLLPGIANWDLWHRFLVQQRTLGTPCTMKLGVSVQGHQSEVDNFAVDVLALRFVSISDCWRWWKISQCFWNKIDSPLAFIISSFPRDRRSVFWVIALAAYAVEVAVSWVSEAWNFWKLWCLPPVILSSFRKLDLFHQIAFLPSSTM